MTSPFIDNLPPPWATGWGQDRFGYWVVITLAGEDIRLRWIPPGKFEMGSPVWEVGRFDAVSGNWNEGPQHLVKLPEGFWLAEHACTQRVWQVVMGQNPSRFKSPTRPVERVSWNDVQKFLLATEKLQPGLGLGLPSEAQWEYACRGGTTTATYGGDLKWGEEERSPVVDILGWYGGNSGENFRLEGEKRGTHPVGRKLPNPWGLYDMLGNVWEWCQDGRRAYSAQAVTRPLGSQNRGVARVVRGGSWFNYARYLRAANRYASEPGLALVPLGFRLCRGPAPRTGP